VVDFFKKIFHNCHVNSQMYINMLSRYRTSYSRRIISCSHG